MDSAMICCCDDDALITSIPAAMMLLMCDSNEYLYILSNFASSRNSKDARSTNLYIVMLLGHETSEVMRGLLYIIIR